MPDKEQEKGEVNISQHWPISAFDPRVMVHNSPYLTNWEVNY
jgi:hypothetical protein